MQQQGKRPVSGRPPLGGARAQARKSKILQVLLTPAQLERLDELAFEMGVSRSELARRALEDRFLSPSSPHAA